ncbi:MAG: hypothetical protein LBR43_01045 [Spiroplasmataceae bacterium]|nr:hypothetical protein [Spiroplasmataceae bacterium]
MPNQKVKKNDNEAFFTRLSWEDKLDQEIVQNYLRKFRTKGDYCLIYTTQDQLDKLFTVFSNQEKEKWKVFRDAFGRYYRWERNNVKLIAVWTQFTKDSFKEFFSANFENASQHFSIASYSWNCLTKHKESWQKFKENFRSIRNSSLDLVCQDHYGGTLGPWMQTFQLGEFKNAWKADINACYNYHLSYSPLPVGNYTEIKDHRQIKKELEEKKQGLVYFRLIGDKNDYIGKHYPWFPAQNKDKKDWPQKISAKTYLIHTRLLPHLLSDYSLDIRYLKFFIFEHKTGILKNFGNYYHSLKTEHHKGSWQNIIGKAVPNLIVGKFGEHY